MIRRPGRPSVRRLVLLTLMVMSLLDPHAAGCAAVKLPLSFAPLVAEASPGVVNIAVKKRLNAVMRDRASSGTESPPGDEFNPLFDGCIPREYPHGAMGSGFLIDRDGYILTTSHVIEDAAAVSVRLSDDRRYDAVIVGWDSATDLALIRIKPDDRLQPLRLGDSDTLQVGDWVVAIGNPFGLGHTVTSGIISAKYRRIGMGIDDRFIQTDASINPGNSGGPLLNLAGEVVGINSAIFTQSGGSQGIGFAIPINQAKLLLPRLHRGRIRRAWLGVLVQDITLELRQALDLDVHEGALVSQVISDGPAARAGIRRDDVIVAFDGRTVGNARALSGIAANTPVDKETVIDVRRQRQTLRLPITTGEMAEAEQAEESPRPDSRLGFTLQRLTPVLAQDFGLSRDAGILITQVDDGSPADNAGLSPGDVIIEADRQVVTELEAFQSILDRSGPGRVLLLLVDREGKTFYFAIPLT